MSCYNESVYEDDTKSDFEAAFLNGYLEETEIEGDRHIIEFIKSIMAQERDVKADMINILKEQILVLRQELFYKQSVIDTLLRNYEAPCAHNNLPNNQDFVGNTVFRSMNNPVNHNNPIGCEHMNGHVNSANKPIITLYSTHSPASSPYSANLVNSHNNLYGDKIGSPLISPFVSSHPISSFVTKAVEKFEESQPGCPDASILNGNVPEKDQNNNSISNMNKLNSLSTSETDLTQWKYKHSPTPSRIPTSKPISGNETYSPNKELGKPLSETLLNVRNLLKSNIPRPQKECTMSPRRENSQKKEGLQNGILHSPGKNGKVGHDQMKDVISTHKTFRVKFKKDGSQGT